MKNFPNDKYKYYVGRNKVIAVSTYAGRTVRGIAKCAPGDSFSVEKGKKLAAARCNLKIAEKRAKRATAVFEQALKEKEAAINRFNDMDEYLADATILYKEALHRVEYVLSEM